MMDRIYSSRFACLAMLFAMLVTGVLLHAQVLITSAIVGTVTDMQQAVVPGAEVVLKNLDTGVTTKAVTDAAGGYSFPHLIAGRYQVNVTMTGFAPAVSTVVSLENGTTQRINVALKVGTKEEIVQVTSAAPLVDTETADISAVIDNNFAQELPMEGRNYLNYAQILPDFNSGTGDNTR